MTCKWDRESNEYLIDGQPCRRDDYGDPTRHCTARRTCSVHIGRDELTCPRCIGRTRADLRWIRDLSSLLTTAAECDGVNSEAANLAGPSVDPEAWSWRKAAARQGVSWHLSLIEDDDEHHPLRVTQTWARMLGEDYGHDVMPTTVAEGVAYLERVLHRIAQDDGQDFPLLARELRRCRQHIEAVLHNDTRPDRGAPCPACKDDGHFVRLVRLYGHWCDNEDCAQQFHYATVLDGDTGEVKPDTTGDLWQCPRKREHQWSETAYRSYVEERTA